MNISVKPGQKINVLIADDEIDIRETLVEFLEMMEIFTFIIQAGDGAEASLKFKNQDFDLVITDLMMPKVKGIDFIQVINKEDKKQKRRTPIIILSANVTGEEVQKALFFGVKYVMTKPCTAEQFIEKIEEVLTKDLKAKIKITE